MAARAWHRSSRAGSSVAGRRQTGHPDRDGRHRPRGRRDRHPPLPRRPLPDPRLPPLNATGDVIDNVFVISDPNPLPAGRWPTTAIWRSASGTIIKTVNEVPSTRDPSAARSLHGRPTRPASTASRQPATVRAEPRWASAPEERSLRVDLVKMVADALAGLGLTALGRG